MARPPKLPWNNDSATAPSGNRYMIQSEIVRGEPRVYYACRLGARWEGPSRRTATAAKIDAEYHEAGQDADRPKCFAFSI